MKEIHTFKLEGSTLQMLRESARRQDISPNALAERVLSESLKKDMFSKSFGWIAIGRETLQWFLQSIDTKELVNMGQGEGRKNFELVRATMESYGRGFSLFEFVVEVLGHQARWFEVEGADIKPERILLRHGCGMNWSMFLKGYIAGASEAALGARASVETFEGFLRVAFSSKNSF